MNYYFLAASLPDLSFDSGPWMPVEEFRSMCREHLTARDAEALDSLFDSAVAAPGHPAVRQWRNSENGLRNALARARGSALKRDVSGYLRPEEGYDGEVVKAALDALSRENPRDTEVEIDRFRWRKATELAGFNPFSIEAIMAYGLKLSIGLRWRALSREDGMKYLETVVNREPGADREDSREKA